MGFGMMGGFGLMGLLFNVLIVVGLVVLIVWAVKRFSVSGGGPANAQSPREILQARYARGEITREQYLQMIDDLK